MKRQSGGARAWRGGGRWGLVLLVGVLACAGTKQPGSEPTSGSGASGASGASSGGDGGAVGGEPATPAAKKVDADVRGLLVSVYGGAELRGASVEEAEMDLSHLLRYELARAHEEADGAALKSGLAGAGYSIERALVDERAAAILARGHGVGVTMAVDVGSTRLEVSIDEAR